jgi:hypothetical protein
MTKPQIIELQKRIGATPDGFWGPKSIAACQNHLRALMPSSHSWPKSDQASLQAFYGAPGDETRLVSIDVSGLGVLYENKPVKSIRVNKACASSLLRVLTRLATTSPGILRKYAGVYNNRTMRGGSSPSLHARGAAIDLSAEFNGNHTTWPISATMPIEVMEEFSREGWISAGAFWGRDAMHFQATQ